MVENTIRVGIVGAGRNTVSRHIPGLLAQDNVEIVSVCNRSRASSQRVADRFNIPTVYDDWRDLVVAPDTDAIVIGTWPYVHKPITIAALEQEKHVLCEARMAMNLNEAYAMYEAARQRPHLVAQLVPAPMTLEVDATAARLLGTGELGDLLAIEVRDQQGFINYEAPLHWRDNADLSGMNIMSLGIWYEMVMRWVGEATRVMAMGTTFVRTRHDPDSNERIAVRIPDHLTVAAEMACGAQASFSVSRVMGHALPTSLTFYGSEATLRFSEGTLSLARRGDSQFQAVSIPEEERGGWRVEQSFINAIRGWERVTLTTFETGVKYMGFTEAVARSLAEGKAIPIVI